MNNLKWMPNFIREISEWKKLTQFFSEKKEFQNAIEMMSPKPAFNDINVPESNVTGVLAMEKIERNSS